MSDVGYSREELEAERQRRANRQPSRNLVREAAYANGGRLSMEDLRRERARRSSERLQQGQPRTATQDALGGISSFNQGFFLGAGDEISGAIGGAIDAGGALFRGDDIGEAYQRGYRREADAARGALQSFREDRPNVAAFTEGSGGAAPILLTMGAAAPQATAAQTSRGLGAFARQTATGAATGAGYGGVYGFNAADGDLEDRAEGAREGMIFGGALGAAAPTAVNAARGVYDRALRPAWQGLARQAERIPTPAPNTVGMGGGNMFAGGGSGALRPPERPSIPAAAVNTIDRLAGRRGMSAQQLDDQMAAARENPQGQVLADLFDDPGVRTTRAIAQSPGQTGQLAAETARERFQRAPDRIMDELHRRLGVGESPADAMRALEAEYADASSMLYNPLWERPTTPRQQALFSQRIEPLLDDPVLQDALRRGEAIFERESRLGVVQGNIQENLARYLHYVKMGLDDAVGAARRDPTGIQRTEMRGVMELRRRFVQAVDEIIPGYAEARAQWGGLREAEDAIEQGAAFLRMRPDEISAAMQELSPFAQHHARIGLAAEVETKLGIRGSVNGNRNVAEMLGSPEMQRRVAAAFETPQQAADFLDVLNTQNRMMRNAGQWNSGSQTYSNVMHGADEGVQALAEMAGDAATGNLGAAIRKGVGAVQNTVTLGAMERANNQRGAALLRRIDGPEAKAFADEIVRILREREVSRAAADRAAPTAGAAAATSGERNRR